MKIVDEYLLFLEQEEDDADKVASEVEDSWNKVEEQSWRAGMTIAKQGAENRILLQKAENIAAQRGLTGWIRKNFIDRCVRSGGSAC